MQRRRMQTQQWDLRHGGHFSDARGSGRRQFEDVQRSNGSLSHR